MEDKIVQRAVVTIASSWNARPASGLDDVAVDVGQPEIAALEAVGQPLVVEAQQVQDGGLQVVDVDLVPSDAETQLVGFPVRIAAFDSAAAIHMT
jgi:hypothetical protein